MGCNAWKVSVFEVFLVRVFLHSKWIWRDTPYISVFSPNAGKYGPEKLRKWSRRYLEGFSNYHKNVFDVSLCNCNFIVFHCNFCNKWQFIFLIFVFPWLWSFSHFCLIVFPKSKRDCNCWSNLYYPEFIISLLYWRRYQTFKNPMSCLLILWHTTAYYVHIKHQSYFMSFIFIPLYL